MKKISLVIVCALCFFGLLTACMKGNSNTSGNDVAQNNETEPPFMALDEGVLVQKDEVNQRWLVTQYVEKDGNSYVDATWFKLTDKTAIEDHAGSTMARNELQVGQKLEVWAVGGIAESYPMQGTAAKFVLLPDENAASEDPSREVDAKAALQIALNSVSSSMPLGVKSLTWDADRDVWKIDLVEGGGTGVSASVQIDGEDGSIVPEILLENDAFRVYAPEPDSVQGSTFTVSGQARVFEAAFSWMLEDGHFILAEGHEMTDAGAPEWGNFSFEVSYDTASSSHMMLVLYVASAKDGSMEHELIIPLKPEEDLIQHIGAE